MAHLAIHFHFEQHQLLAGIIIPGFPRRFLIMPGIGAIIGVHGDDRGQEQVVSLSGITVHGIPGCAVAGAEDNKISLRVVGDGIPDSPTGALFPPAFFNPGFGDHGLSIILEAVGGIAGHGIKAPEALAGVHIVGIDMPAHVELTAGGTDKDLAVCDTRCTGNRVAALRCGLY